MLELLTEALELLDEEQLDEYMSNERKGKYVAKTIGMQRKLFKLKKNKQTYAPLAKKLKHRQNREHQRLTAIEKLRSQGKLKKEEKE